MSREADKIQEAIAWKLGFDAGLEAGRKEACSGPCRGNCITCMAYNSERNICTANYKNVEVSYD